MAEKEIKYINKDFNNFKQDLIDFAKSYFPNSYNDFTEATPGHMFIEMASYVGDVLSFYGDTQITETQVLNAKEKSNLMALAYEKGYKPRVTSTSTTTVEIYQLVPAVNATSSFYPNFNYALTINPNTILTSAQRGITFLTQDLVDFSFSSSVDPTEITVYQVDGSNNPVYYLLKKKVKANAGTINTETFTFGSPERFPSITLNKDNIIGILDVYDSNNNKWYEVPYLGQETIFEEIKNINSNDPNFYTLNNSALYIIKLKKVPRRFVTRFRSDNLLEIKFGAGISSSPDEEIIPNPDNVGIGLIDGVSKLNVAYDPSNFLYTRTYGLAPYNTTLTIRYLTGGGVESNVNSNDITIIDKTNLSYNTGLNSTILSTVLNSLIVNNPEPAVGGRDGDGVDELRENILSTFGTQLRAVTKQDYAIRALSMPARYGTVSKIFVTQDSLFSENSSNDILIDNNPLSLSLYILSFDSNKKLTNTSLIIKENLKTYLNQYRMLNDALTIKDAFIINIGVNFEIITLPGFNNREVLTNCIVILKEHFNINRWQINQPIILSEIYNKISQVKGVQSVPKVEIINKQGGTYSQYGYDIKGATKSGVIYPSLNTSIFEVKYPDSDILGRTVGF